MRTYGLIIRMFSPDEHGAQERVDLAMNGLFRLHQRFSNGGIAKIVFLVPQDHDEGETYDRLERGLLGQRLVEHHHVFPAQGHPNREVLNAGAMILESHKVTHMIVSAPRALAYLSPSLLVEVDRWFADGARVVGVKAGELGELVEYGCVQNTLAVWDLFALQRAGRFKSEVAEEIAPTVGLVERFGKCIAVVDGGDGPLDIRDSPAARAKRGHKLALKQAQQAKELERVRGEFGQLALAVMNRPD